MSILIGAGSFTAAHSTVSLAATGRARRVLALAAILALSAVHAPRGEGVGTLVYVVLQGSDSGWTSSVGLAVMHPDGSNHIRLTYNDDTEPSWSPDGNSIAFSRSADIYVIPAAGGPAVNLTNHPASDSSPAWSPDGRRLAFASDRGGLLELYLMNADGSGVARLTGNVASTGLPFRPATSRVAWAPDGSALAFTCRIDSDNIDICTIKVDGSGLTRLTATTGRDSDPAWSPNGGTIAFATERYGTTLGTGDGEVWPATEIALMNSDGSGVRALRAGLAAEYPSWSPDGARIAVDILEYFDWLSGAYMNVSVLDVDGSVSITSAASGASAAWRPVGGGNLPPRASFSATCWAHTCSFDAAASADADGSVASYQWNFGDGTTGSARTTSHLYPTGNPYIPTLTIVDDNGAAASATRTVEPNNRPVVWARVSCSGVTCAFDASDGYDDGTVVSYVWAFGDGTSASGVKVTHTYSTPGIYIVAVTVTDNDGASVTQGETAFASRNPIASFTAVCDRLVCAFDASASTAPDSTIVSYVWGFSDQTDGEGRVVSHTYAAASSYYRVLLIVRDNLGRTGSQEKLVSVAPTATPMAAFTTMCSDLACTFDGSSSAAPESTLTSYQWDFGDGSAGFDRAMSHTYRAPGTYTVVLTVRDNFYVSDDQRTNVVVTSTPAHVGDIDAVVTGQGPLWGTTVAIEIHGDNHGPLANVRVSGYLDHGAGGECITAANGRCSIQFGGLPKQARSTTFSVHLVSQPGSYKSAKNHDPDGDSNGTTIVVKRP